MTAGASLSQDFSNLPSTLTIPAGQLSKSLTITSVDNNTYEGNRNYTLALTSKTTGVTVKTSSLPITLQDNETAPTVSFSAATQTVSETAGTATVTLQMSSASARTTVIPITLSGTAVAGTHYSVVGGSSSVSIPAGQTSGTLQLQLVNDTLFNVSRTIVLQLGSLTGATAGSTNSQTITVTNEDPMPSLTISNATVNEDAGSVNVTVTQSAASAMDVSFSWATSNGTAIAGTNYTSVASGSATITAGQTTTTVSVTILHDLVATADLTLNVLLSNPVNATIADNTGVITIQNTDSNTTTAPSSLTLVTPSSSPSNNVTPVVRVSGVTNGATVYLYNDSTCSVQVATGTASGTSIDLTSSSLSEGTYTLRAKSQNSGSNLSDCSTALIRISKLYVDKFLASFFRINFCFYREESQCNNGTCCFLGKINAVLANKNGND